MLEELIMIGMAVGNELEEEEFEDEELRQRKRLRRLLR